MVMCALYDEHPILAVQCPLGSGATQILEEIAPRRDVESEQDLLTAEKLDDLRCAFIAQQLMEKYDVMISQVTATWHSVRGVPRTALGRQQQPSSRFK